MAEHQVACICVDCELKRGIASVLNQYSRENESNTPDFILAEIAHAAIVAYESAHNRTLEWWQKAPPQRATGEGR